MKRLILLVILAGCVGEPPRASLGSATTVFGDLGTQCERSEVGGIPCVVCRGGSGGPALSCNWFWAEKPAGVH